MLSSRIIWRWEVLALVVLAGCGRALPECAVVTGRVLVDNQPVNQGQVCFWPENGRPAMAALESDGTFRLTTFEPGDGAVVGQHRVSIDAKRVVGKGRIPQSIEEEAAILREGRPANEMKLHWLAPEKYSRAETSGLNVEVKPGENQIDFLIPTDGDAKIEARP